MNIKFILLTFFLNLIKYCQNENYEYDFCNVNDSKAAYYIIRNIIDYYKINSQDSFKCFITNENFVNYVERFIKLDNFNKNAYNQFKCPICEKKFKNRNFLNMHYKIFHTPASLNYTENNSISSCPANFCRFINCDRYKRYLSLSTEPNKDNTLTNRQPKENIQECNKELIEFYRKNCMKIVSNCLGKITEDLSPQKYFDFYNNICMKIKCNRDDPGYNSYKEELQPEGSLFDALRLVTLYIVSIFIIIYILIIWVSKYS